MRRRRISLPCLLVLGAWLTLALPAAASVVHEREGGFPLSGINFLAVDNSAGPSAGDLYIGESQFGSAESRVFQTDPAGIATGVELDGSETPAGSFGFLDTQNFRAADGPAVDGSTGARAGDVYVPDVINGVVDLFDESGHYVCQITGSATPSASECAATGSETPAGGLVPLSVAVNPTNGDLAVGDARGIVYEFDEVGNFVGEIADPHVTQPGSIAFDSTGSLYVVNQSPFTGTGDAVKFAPAGGFEDVVASGRSSVGVDLGEDHVYLGVIPEGPIEEFDSAGHAISSFGDGAISLDVSTATGKVYVAPLFGEGQIWSGGIFAAAVTTGGASEIGQTSATLAGHVDPEIPAGGSAVTACEFEYGEDETYGLTAPCSPSPPYGSPADVSAALSGLSPSTTYDYRLVAVNSEGQARGENRTFTTPGPAGISDETAIARTTSATVTAQINPFGFETSCEVEYVDEASFQDSGYGSAATAPCAEQLAAGFGSRTATAELGGLRIGTAYRYRFVAANQGGTSVGADQAFSTFGIESFSIETVDEEGQPYTQAGGHPYAMKVVIGLTTTSPVSPRNPKSASANLRTVEVNLPPGLIGNPTATPTCSPSSMKPNQCPGSTQVGLATVSSPRGASEFGPVYNLTPPDGVAAQLGARFNAFGTARVDAGVRTGSDYGVTARSIYVTADEAVERIEMTLWGVPAAAAHFSERFCAGEGLPSCPSDAPLRPFLTNPTSCSGPLTSALSVDAWQDPGNFVGASSQLPAITGCERLQFKPAITIQPDVRTADSPTGMDVDLHIDQNQSATALAEANLKDVAVTLPPGLVVNPSGANGLTTCSPAQVDLHGSAPATCPDAAKIGSVEVDTPLLDHPLAGSVYVATPHQNPFGSLLAIYLAIADPRSGVVVKLAGEVTPDPRSGQLTATFSENPQLPFEDFRLDFFGGPEAALMTPQTCGEHTTTTTMSPWASPQIADAHPSDSFQIRSGPNGSRCANTPGDATNDPSFSAGTVTPLAGAFSPFVLNVSRQDGSQRLAAIETKLPPGLLGKLAGVPYCPDAVLAAASVKSGAEENAAPSCPAASRVGTVDVGAGAGSRPYHVSGKAYLAGPYKGGPLSLAIVTPAVAGPFDLGVVVVRAALLVDPATTQITARSDQIPAILQGIPLDVRSIALQLDRPRFTLNPTSCERMSVDGIATSILGRAAPLSERFQVGGCAGLGFKPRLSTRIWGKTNRGAHSKFGAVLKMPPGGANIARASVTLPHSQFLDQSHIGTVCTRVQYAASACPRNSIYGYAKARSPLLDKPLRGPVYLRSSAHELPDLVASLDGQIHVDLTARIDSAHSGIRTVFEVVPDAPVSTFVLTMKGGRKGLLQNSTNVCNDTHRAIAAFTGQNGRTTRSHPALTNGRCRGSKDSQFRRKPSGAIARAGQTPERHIHPWSASHHRSPPLLPVQWRSSKR
jgi:hypothetical protein